MDNNAHQHPSKKKKKHKKFIPPLGCIASFPAEICMVLPECAIVLKNSIKNTDTHRYIFFYKLYPFKCPGQTLVFTRNLSAHTLDQVWPIWCLSDVVEFQRLSAQLACPVAMNGVRIQQHMEDSGGLYNILLTPQEVLSSCTQVTEPLRYTLAICIITSGSI